MITAILGGAAGLLGVAATGALGYRASRRARASRLLRLDSPHAIVEDHFLPLGGIEQWVGIRGEDRRNPVLLVLHGGPGSPYSVFTPLLRSWERHFTVVQWDRRGVGKTLGRNGKAGSGEMSFDRMVEDAIALCDFLREHLGQPKVVLLSSSAGTHLGLKLVLRRPDLFAAFVGTDLNVGMAAGEAEAFPATLAWARAAGDRGALALLDHMGPDSSRWDVASFNRLMRLRDRTVTVGRGIGATFLPLMLGSPQHGLGDVLDVISGLAFSTEQLFAELRGFDARCLGRRFEVPFFVFHGEADVFTPAAAARAYVLEVQAPVKHFELLQGSGHLGAFNDPEPFLALLRQHVLPVVAAGPSCDSSRC
ncbi:alpha/beta hydrolase [Corallococcus sp. CA053C]|uniref:alpha/beta fold hydrolase n=1 Tax=Corallococcus sp. CA053C TaxID=2316732 RepID=UPI000EA249E9|nr:alpha/beta hydrolase [Corallococcus sp. CA053C]RKH09311.1 alpha/beta hydrolase [Corallococcus sp. CA053C]